MITDYTFDPILETLQKRTRKRPAPASFRHLHPYSNEWRFCKLCWRSTEYAITLDNPIAVRPLGRLNAKPIPLTDAIREEAQLRADEIVDRYRRARKGEFGMYEPALMVSQYCDPYQTGGDSSVEAFRYEVERNILLAYWARDGILVQLSRLPGQPIDAPKPSKTYCEYHNPRRSVEARRAYQRDRRFALEYDGIIRLVQGALAVEVDGWTAESIATVRREAYLLLQAYKSPTNLINDAIADGAKTQAEIAAVIGVSQQAVSKALKRRREKPRSDDLQPISNYFAPAAE